MTCRPALRIGHLYPAEMNIYGDRGNIATLIKRLQWREIDVEVDELGAGDNFDPGDFDLLFGGGGQDAGQATVAANLVARRNEMLEARDTGVVMLAICGTYQLLGHSFVTADGKNLPGVGLFDASTEAGTDRLIGNVLVDSDFGQIVGFENHGGRTALSGRQRPLGRVITGYGNNGETGEEGALSLNCVGTYLHGPVLPKNPALADGLIQRALDHRYGEGERALTPLNDHLELAAARTATDRPQ